MLRLARIVERTRAEGPGVRSALWVQGCTVRCPGCFNPHTWSRSGGRTWPIDDVFEALTRSPDIEGVTLLGGEPFDQAHALAKLAGLVRRKGLSVMAFTGHTRERLEGLDAPDGAEQLLGQVDLLVDGPFLLDLPDRQRPWVGSTNQRFHALTDIYAKLVPTLDQVDDRLEVKLQRDGQMLVNGFADLATVEALLEGLGRRHRG